VRRPRTARAVTAAWPSLLVHPKVMHVPCQSGTTAPWACTLWWSKALRAAGDHLQRRRAHVPLPGGGQPGVAAASNGKFTVVGLLKK